MSHKKISSPPSFDNNYVITLKNSFESSYEIFDDVWSQEPAMRQIIDFILPKLEKNSQVLDVGAGKGYDALKMLQIGHRVDALDLVIPKELKSIARIWPQRMSYIQGDFISIDLDKRYDAVLDNGCFHHQHPDLYLDYLNKLWRHTCKNAVLAINLFTPCCETKSGTLWKQDDRRLTRDFTEEEAIKMLKTAKWEVEEIKIVKRHSGTHDYMLIIARRIE
ncbi:MAG: class I SAM-dependent methyltransferase [Neisseriaceae bacterium]|nr:MAG: class I SAM-dependent methyltransferase [Neisseriaceae bacterium]